MAAFAKGWINRYVGPWHWEAGSWPLRGGSPTSGPFGEITLVAGWASRRTLLSECLRMSDPPQLGLPPVAFMFQKGAYECLEIHRKDCC